MIILGVDPGYKRVGYGLVKKEGTALSFLDAGILNVSSYKFEGVANQINEHLNEIIKKFKPSVLAVEKLYFSKNQKTALSVAQCRGIIILSATINGLEVKEFSPSEVKAGITGYGSADKKAVAKMVRLFLKIPGLKMIDDATDALALAIIGSSSAPSLR